MAILSIEEPRTKVSENIRDYPILLDIDSTSNIGGVIVAPTGPGLANVKGPQDFLDKYTVDGTIPRNADISLINAYYLSFSTGLVLARSSNTKAVGGVYFTYSEVTGETLTITPTANAKDWHFTVGYHIDDEDSGSNADSDIDKYVVYYFGENPSSSDKVPTASDIEYKSIDSFEDINLGQVKLDVTSEGNSGVFYFNTKELPFDLCDEYKNNVTLTEDEDSFNSIVSHELQFINGVGLTENWVIDLGRRITKEVSSEIEGNYIFEFNELILYHGFINKSQFEDKSLIKVNTLDDIVSEISGINGFSAVDLSKYGEEVESENKIRIQFTEGNDPVIKSSAWNTGVADNHIDKTGSDTIYNSNKKYLTIYPNTSLSSNQFKVEFDPNNGTIFTLKYTDLKGEVSSFEVSLLDDDLDSTGNNCFIENLNTTGLDVTFIANPDFKLEGFEAGDESINQIIVESPVITPFGKSDFDLSQSKNVKSKINALYKLDDQELYDIEYLAPFGETDSQFIKAYVTVGRSRYWFAPFDIPKNRTNVSSIKVYANGVEDTSQTMGLYPFDNNSGLLGWRVPIAATTLYYTRVMNNKAANKEFAPVFDLTNGILDYTNPDPLFGATERKALLNFKCPVDSVIYNQRSDVYYLNDNRTHQSKINLVSEEHIRRAINKINKDAKRILDSFKGRVNTISTRQDVTTSLNYYFSTNIMNQQYRPEEYRVICNSTNNTEAIINANKLAVKIQVRYAGSIKFIDALTDVFPLGVEFEE